MKQTELDRMVQLHQKWLGGLQDGKKLVLMGVDLSIANLREADLERADLRWANLRGVDLRWANLEDADLEGADLRGSDLSGSDLRGADLRFVDLSGANLRGANLRRADLRWADLERVNLEGIKGKNIITYQGSKHFAYYCDGIVKIGCITKSLEWWLDNVDQAGEDNDYTDDQIQEYKSWLEHVSAED